MTLALDQIIALQQRISESNENETTWLDEYFTKVYFAQIHGLLHVEFYGTPFDEAFQDFIATISQPEVADSLHSLVFRGPDEGANGTRNWDFTELIDAGVEFGNLNSFFVELTALEHHNCTIIAQSYEEEGMIAALMTAMPRLLSLTVPSAPDSTFFSFKQHPLQSLRVESGYDHQNFISNLSASSSFPNLRFLDFGDHKPQWADDPALPTSFEDYADLMQSLAFHKVGYLRIRNCSLSADQALELKQLKPDLQLYLIQAAGHYVR